MSLGIINSINSNIYVWGYHSEFNYSVQYIIIFGMIDNGQTFVESTL